MYLILREIEAFLSATCLCATDILLSFYVYVSIKNEDFAIVVTYMGM